MHWYKCILMIHEKNNKWIELVTSVKNKNLCFFSFYPVDVQYYMDQNGFVTSSYNLCTLHHCYVHISVSHEITRHCHCLLLSNNRKFSCWCIKHVTQPFPRTKRKGWSKVPHTLKKVQNSTLQHLNFHVLW